MSNTQRLVIRGGTSVTTIFDINSLLDFTYVNLRKLWRFMFNNAWENRESITQIREWLPQAIAENEKRQAAYKIALAAQRSETESIRRSVEAYGSMATETQRKRLKESIRYVKAAESRAKSAKARYERAEKLLSIFTDMATKAGV